MLISQEKLDNKSYARFSESSQVTKVSVFEEVNLNIRKQSLCLCKAFIIMRTKSVR